MNTIPLRDTVAGDALSMLCGSKATLQFGAMGMRSPLARVRVLLSSKTEFKFSIQMASTGPSKTIQMFSPMEKNEEKSFGKLIPHSYHYRNKEAFKSLKYGNDVWCLYICHFM